MVQEEGSMKRRNYLAGGIGIGTAAIAGCLGGGSRGSGSSEEKVEFTMAGVYNEDVGGWDGGQPCGFWKLAQRLEEESDGRIQASVVGGGQICGETSCPSKIESGVVEVGGSSMGNTTGAWPANDIFLLPYTFPNRISLAHILTQEETWKDYWVPFAKEHGIIPLYYLSPHLRQINMGIDVVSKTENSFRRPDDIQGKKVRVTQSSVSTKAINNTSANAVSVAWGDTLQGLKTGVVDGAEGADVTLAFGLAEVVGETIRNNWTIHNQTNWVRVDWLKQLPEEDLEILANETKQIYEDLVQMTDEIRKNRHGSPKGVQEGTVIDGNNIKQNYLNKNELQMWKDRISIGEHPDLYSEIFEYADKLGIDGKGFHEYLWNEARSNSVPNSVNNFTVDSWWDEFLPEM